MHILVTGAFGFIGLNLVRLLASYPDVTITAADLRAPDPAMLAFLSPVMERVEIVMLDVTDRVATHAVMDAVQPTHIIHAAAITPSPDLEKSNPTTVVDTNLNGVINVLDAVRDATSVERVVMVSSSGVYGSAGVGERQLEEGPLALGGLYAITKYCGELLAARYGQLGGAMIASLRLPPVYGPMERASMSRPRISQVAALLQALKNGQHVKVANPSVARDWTHVEDIARGTWALLTAEKWNHAVYNVSFGARIPFNEVVECFMAHGLSAEWTDDPAAADILVPPESARLPLDIHRLQTDTNFVPSIDIAAGVARLLAS